MTNPNDLKPMFSGPLAFEPVIIDTAVSVCEIDSAPFEEECGVVIHPLATDPSRVALSLFDDLTATSVKLNFEQIMDTINALTAGANALLIGDHDVLGKPFDFVAFLDELLAWSLDKFGTGTMETLFMQRIRRAAAKVTADDKSLDEWVDVILLALDGAMRCGDHGAAVIDAEFHQHALEDYEGELHYLGFLGSMPLAHQEVRINLGGHYSPQLFAAVLSRQSQNSPFQQLAPWLSMARTGMNGALSAGHSVDDLLAAMVAKQAVNAGGA